MRLQLTTKHNKLISIFIFFARCDFWEGWYYDEDLKTLNLSIFPTVVLCFSFRSDEGPFVVGHVRCQGYGKRHGKCNTMASQVAEYCTSCSDVRYEDIYAQAREMARYGIIVSTENKELVRYDGVSTDDKAREIYNCIKNENTEEVPSHCPICDAEVVGCTCTIVNTETGRFNSSEPNRSNLPKDGQ